MEALSVLLTPITAMTCIDSEYVYEDCINNGASVFVNQVAAFIEDDPSLNKLGILNTATNTLQTVVNSGVEIKLGDSEMINTFESIPKVDWTHYNIDDENTLKLIHYWTEPSVGGGFITQDL